MSRFDEEPDGNLHGECAAEIHALTDRIAELEDKVVRLDAGWCVANRRAFDNASERDELAAQLEAVGAGGVGAMMGESHAEIQDLRIGLGQIAVEHINDPVKLKCCRLIDAALASQAQPAHSVVACPNCDSAQGLYCWGHQPQQITETAVVEQSGITLDFKMATELLEMYGGDPTQITLTVGKGHSGTGVYAIYTDLPEEGAEFLGISDDEASPQPQQIAEPASQPDEQAVFEDWLSAKCPSGDVESVQYKWEQSSEYADFRDGLATPKDQS